MGWFFPGKQKLTWFPVNLSTTFMHEECFLGITTTISLILQGSVPSCLYQVALMYMRCLRHGKLREPSDALWYQLVIN